MYNDIQINITKNASFGKHAWDIAIDLSLSGLSIYTATAIGGKIGAVAGSYIPILGTIVGAVAGAALGAGIYYFTDEFDYCDGKPLREWLKEGAE